MKNLILIIVSAFVWTECMFQNTDTVKSRELKEVVIHGLDPHRSWEYNIRQNGIIINSDMYGYPASHYSAPMESFEKIELVRGTGSLQYGAQFGGIINYVTRRPDSSKVFTFESVNTAGSFNLLSSYNAISGIYKKNSYYVCLLL